jgi:hypothetical protein
MFNVKALKKVGQTSRSGGQEIRYQQKCFVKETHEI